MPDLLLGKEIIFTRDPNHKSHKVIISDDYEYKDTLINFQINDQKWWLGLNDEELESFKTFLKRVGKINVDDKNAVVIADKILDKINSIS